MMIELGNNRYLTASDFNGVTRVHIREYQDGFPTKKGIALTPNRWAAVLFNLDDINERVQDLPNANYKKHLGGGVYVTVTKGYPCVNIRKYFRPEGAKSEVPTRFGIAIRLSEWSKVSENASKMAEHFPQIANAMPCDMQFSHMNMLDYMDCKECNPFSQLE